MKRLNQRVFLSGLLAVLIGVVAAYAQVDYSTATLKGTVIDPQGAMIAQATVIAVNVSTGVSRETKSGTDGHYQIPALPPGTYQLTFTAAGFAKEVAKVELAVGQSQIFDIHLKVGAATETIEVSADSVPLIQTEQTQQANSINQLQVNELPNIAHNITEQIYTLPGVANADAPRAQTPGFTGFGTTGFSIGGSNGRNNLSTIDGGENEYGTGQYRNNTLPQDIIQEYQVNRNSFAAEFGFTTGSAINIVTKTGGNKFHGTAYGEIQNHDTSATNFFNGIERLPSAFNQNIYSGFTFGGPIKQDKLFFFTSYEYRRLENPDFANSNLLQAPTVLGPSAVQGGYVSALSASGDPVLQNFASRITAPGTQAFGTQTLFPLNNSNLNKILTAQNGIFINPFRLNNSTFRLDGQPNASNSLSLLAIYSHNDAVQGNPDNSSLFTRNLSLLGTWNHTFSSNLLNQAVVQVIPRLVANSIPNSPFQGVNFSLGNLNVGNLGGGSTFGSPSLTPYLAHQQRFQFEDNLTWNHGPHSFKIGASERIANYTITDKLFFNNEFDFRDSVIPLILLGNQTEQGHLAFFNFQAQNQPGVPKDFFGTGCSAATLANPASLAACIGPRNTNLSAPQSFANGFPADVTGGFNNPEYNGTGNYFGSYVQDTWKLTHRVTMNVGVRFDVDSEPSPLNQNVYASPRLGFAWDPFGDQKTVIRFGGGVYYSPIDVLIPSYGSLLDGSGRYINEVLGVLSPTDPRVAQLFQAGVATGILPFGNLTPQQFQQFSTTATLPGYNPNAPGATVGFSVAPNYKDPYTVQGSFSIQRQLGKSYSLELGYNTYHGVHLQMPLETAYAQINPGNPLCPTPACVDLSGGPLYAPTTGQFQHTTYTSNGTSKYNAGTASFTKRYSSNLQFQVNYTYSKAIDNTIDFASFQNFFRPSQLRSYYTTSVFDVPQILVANAVYNSPFKTGTGNFLKTMFADIALAPVETWRSGLPFSIRTPSLNNKVITNQALDNNFATPFGVSRDTLRGPVYGTTDLNFTKSFFISRERGMKLNFIATGTNIFNRTNFNKVSDVFDINGIGPTGLVNTARGPVNLFTGPFNGLHGVKPTNANQIQQPLFYSGADLPRLIQLGLRFAF